jgi:hypothetical protein
LPPDSGLAQKTLAQMETLWNQAWQGGGYGRYHVSSEPDSPGAWAFPSLFVARAYAETGDLARVWRVLEWLSRVPGGVSGAWFEYYGERLAPPFPQQGIVPWTWAEMLMLLVHHIVGIRPQDDRLVIRPRLLPGLERIEGHFPFRGHRLSIKITRAQKGEPSHFSANTPLLHTDQSEAHLPNPPHDLHLTAHLQQ